MKYYEILYIIHSIIKIRTTNITRFLSENTDQCERRRNKDDEIRENIFFHDD